MLAKFREPPRDQVAYWYRKFWPRMPYFALPSFADGHVRVNLRGRGQAGRVVVVGVPRRTGDLEDPVVPGQRLTDIRAVPGMRRGMDEADLR